ncbi:FKBP-type peptidyl-prolyl cis-trans isomerase [uncultured Mucilaginibacter sp.]|uniref:FKBP-type peptidyl-prolyl cis-trans isomerase n=1 Tax=uncultured Mucilaginibacter sp. TaxID=797541 RepID=UPI0025EBA9FF|nr:FKBP-type peptidyl-prolyl cis-trans isomerase [uncultured Mucilaginibacter sp.]
MKKKLVLLVVAAASLAGCKNFKQGDGGMLYNIVEDKSGPKIKEGDVISLNGVIKNEADSVLSSTYEMGHQWATQVSKPQFKGDLISGLELLSEGDSAVLKINADTASKRSGQPKPPGFKGKYYVYCVRIEKVFAKDKKQPDSVFNKKISAYFKSLNDKIKADEPIKIKKYIADNKLNVVTTASGLSYVITQQGNGPKAANGDTAVVNYIGKFLNGKVFDTSILDVAKQNKRVQPGRPYAPVRIPVGVHAVIPGWDETLALLPKGTKATVIIPSSLAYGEQGMQGLVGPFTPLVFEMEIVDVKHPNPNAPKPVLPTIPQGQVQQPQTKK